MNNKKYIAMLSILVVLVITDVFLYQIPVIYGVIFNARNILLYLTIGYALCIISYYTYEKLNIKENYQLRVKTYFYGFILLFMALLGVVQINYLENHVIPEEMGCKYYDKYNNLIYESILQDGCPSLDQLEYQIDDLKETLSFTVRETEDNSGRNETLVTSVIVTYNVYTDLIGYHLESRYEKVEDGIYTYEGLLRDSMYEYSYYNITYTNSFVVYQEISNDSITTIDFQDYPTIKTIYEMSITGHDSEESLLYTTETTDYSLYKSIDINGEINSYFKIADGSKEEMEFLDGDYTTSYQMVINDYVVQYQEGELQGVGAENRFYLVDDSGSTTENYTIANKTMISTVSSFGSGKYGGYSFDLDNAFDDDKTYSLNQEEYYIEDDLTAILSGNEEFSKIVYYNTDRSLANRCMYQNGFCEQDEMFLLSDTTELNAITSNSYHQDSTAVNFHNPLFLIQNDYYRLYSSDKVSPLDIYQTNKLLSGFVDVSRIAEPTRAMAFLESYDFDSLLLYGYQVTTNKVDLSLLLDILYQDPELYELFLSLLNNDITIQVENAGIVKTDQAMNTLTVTVSTVSDQITIPIHFMYIVSDTGSFSGDMLDIDGFRVALMDTASNGYFRIIYNEIGTNVFWANITGTLVGETSFDLTDTLTLHAEREYLGITMTLISNNQVVTEVHLFDDQYYQSGESSYYSILASTMDYYNYGDYRYELENYAIYDQNLFLNVYVIESDSGDETYIPIILSDENNYTETIDVVELPYSYTYVYEPDYPNVLKVMITNDLGETQILYYNLQVEK